MIYKLLLTLIFLQSSIDKAFLNRERLGVLAMIYNKDTVDMATKKTPNHPCVPIFGQSIAMYVNLVQWLKETYLNYGSISECKMLKLGKTYVCLGKEFFHSVLVDNHDKISSKLGFQPIMGVFFKDSFPLTDGVEHTFQRKIFHQAFHPQHLKRYCELSNRIFHRFFSKYVESSQMMVHSELKRMVFANGIAMFLGIDDGILSDKLNSAYTCLLNKGIYSLTDINLPGFPFYKAKKADNFIENELNLWFENNKKKMQNNLFNQILQSLDNGGEKSNRVMLGGFKFILFGMHDTLSSVLSFAFLYLSKNRDIQAQLTEFVSKNYGVDFFLKSNKVPDMLDCFFLETTRLSPPTQLITRFITEDIELNDFVLKKGKNLLLSPLFVHRHEEYWTKPNDFILDRFVDPNNIEAINSAYFPFGFGEHQCIGKHVARLTFRVIISNFLYHSQIENISNHVKIKYLPFPFPRKFKVKIQKKTRSESEHHHFACPNHSNLER